MESAKGAMILVANCRRTSTVSRGTLVPGRKHVNKAGRNGGSGGSGVANSWAKAHEDRGEEGRGKLRVIPVTGTAKRNTEREQDLLAKKNLDALFSGEISSVTLPCARGSACRIKAPFMRHPRLGERRQPGVEI